MYARSSGVMSRVGEPVSLNSPAFSVIALKFGPLHQLFVVVPLGNDADGADDTGVVGKDLVGRGGHVIRAAGADGLDRGHHGFFFSSRMRRTSR